MNTTQRRKKESDTPPVSHSEEVKAPSNINQGSSPSVFVAFLLLLTGQLLSSFFNYISDCDETFNYWEPTHFIQHHKGLQTWEYSPTYALRSYAYLWPQAAVGMIVQQFTQNKVFQFYLVRSFLGLCCASAQTVFYSGIKSRYSPSVANWSLVFLLFSTGNFIAGTAYLPSSFAMYCFMVADGLRMMNQPRLFLSVLFVALAALMGWPFSALVGLPIALFVLANKGFIYFIKNAIVSGIFCMVPILTVDYYYYGKLVIAPLNIVVYNVFNSGSELYGVESWTFYFKNSFLNFNFIFVFALVGVLLIPLFGKFSKSVYSYKTSSPKVKVVVPGFFNEVSFNFGFLLWFAFMTLQPHKEERFLFPIYGHIALAGSLGVVMFIQLLFYCFKEGSFKSNLIKLFSLVLFVVIVGLCLSRTFALVNYYSAPVKAYNSLSTHLTSAGSQSQVNVCVGDEWYRFPASYFLPGGNVNLTFIRQSAQGQLPQYFPSKASEILPNFNNENKEEMTRYVDIGECHYVVDKSSESVRLERYPLSQYSVLSSFRFLDVDGTPNFLMRAYYVPLLSDKKNSFHEYYIVKKN
eukprot:TRINITY_DN10668_c0_g1_i1.p1 TRINITY_DN10668_c0_g1~~TRINITY_DN10668_c0_g1_i1.p1  ORF type:complete len:577 (+),score=70.51 TRINITY_DN10668_c0_g1_i1:14-1744(+)